MGTRAYSEAHKLVTKQGGALASNYKLQVLYDGINTVGSGQQPNLAGNELWWDGTGLYRVGLNNGPTFQNIGSTPCTIYGSLAPKEYAQLINKQASLETLMSTKWKSLGTINPGDVVSTLGTIYTLFRFVFTPGTNGEVVAAAL